MFLYPTALLWKISCPKKLFYAQWGVKVLLFTDKTSSVKAIK